MAPTLPYPLPCYGPLIGKGKPKRKLSGFLASRAAVHVCPPGCRCDAARARTAAALTAKVASVLAPPPKRRRKEQEQQLSAPLQTVG